MENDSISKTMTVALLLCLVCSVLVSLSAVGLRERHLDNKALYEKKNLLLVAGLLHDSRASREEVLQAFEAIEAKVIDFETGAFAEDIDPETYDQEKASRDSSQNYSVSSHEDIAGIKTRAKYGKIYFVRKDNEVTTIIVPIKGRGLWSTLYGLLALASDGNTVRGIRFYQHGETPGLGGEIDNPQWQTQWRGKKIYAEDAIEPIIRVVKGRVEASDEKAHHKIDGLTGATITSIGVENLVNYWHGESQYGAFLSTFREKHEH